MNINISVRLSENLNLLVDDKSKTRLEGQLTKYARKLVKNLGLPSTIHFELSLEQQIDVPYQILIDGNLCRAQIRTGSTIFKDLEQVLRELCITLLNNRQLLISEELAHQLQQDWAPENSPLFLASLSRKAFQEYLQHLVSCFFSIQRAKKLDLQSDLESPTLKPLALFEQTIASIKHLNIKIHQNVTKVDQFKDRLEMMRDGLFYETGVRLPKVELVNVETVNAYTFCLQVNDVEFPVFSSLKSDELLINDTVENLKLLGIEGTAAVNPSNNNACTIAKDINNWQELCQKENLTTWNTEDYAVLAISAELRKLTGSFVVQDSVRYDLDLLSDAFPDLIEFAQKRFAMPKITQVLRHLADEGISFRDLRKVLEALLAVNSVVQEDVSRLITFTSYALTPAFAGRDKVDDVSTIELAECVRQSLRRYISHKYTRGHSTLVVYLLDPGIETRIIAANNQPLQADEIEKYIQAVAEEVGNITPSAQVPAILTTQEVRPYFWRLIALEFPQIPVLSYQELSPEMNIQPIARISLNDDV